VSRLFDSASSQYLEVDAAAIASAPFTVLGQVAPTGLVANEVIFWLGDKDVTNQYWQVIASSTSALRIAANAGAGNVVATTINTFTSGQWAHIAARITSATDREVILDADFGNAATNTVNTSPAGADRMSIGRQGIAIPALYYNGRIGWLGLWNAVLTDAEITASKNGVSPWHIRPANRIDIWPLWGNRSPEPSLVSGGNSMTVTGATKDTGPPVTLFTPKWAANTPLIEVAVAGAIMNQLQGPNLGSDLFNGTIL